MSVLIFLGGLFFIGIGILAVLVVIGGNKKETPHQISDEEFYFTKND